MTFELTRDSMEEANFTTFIQDHSCSGALKENQRIELTKEWLKRYHTYPCISTAI
jgi:hypothetical protein